MVAKTISKNNTLAQHYFFLSILRYTAEMNAAYADNKKISHEFEILETLEAGIELLGLEVKAVRAHKMSLAGSYIFPRNGEIWLVGATIAPYQPSNTPKDYEPTRERKLLLRQHEIQYLIGKFSTKGLTLLPLRVYNKNNRIKLLLAVARKFKKHDKRQRIRERETNRKVERTLKEI